MSFVPQSHPPPRRGEIVLPSDLTEKSVLAWLSELPLANIDYSGQALLQLLRHLNQKTGLACAERLALLESLRGTVYVLANQSVETHLSGDIAFPLPRQARRGVNLGLLLCKEFGRGFRHIVGDPSFLSHGALSEPTRHRVIYRALEAHSESLHKTLAFYTPPARGFWHDVYGLYRLAEQRGIQSELITGVNDRRGTDTIECRFKHILLFPVANSQRHRPLEIRQIHTITGQFAHFAELRNAPDLGGESALFVLDLNSDSPPHPIYAQTSREYRQARYLFTHALVKQVVDYFSDPAHRRWGGVRLRRTLLKRLIHALGAPERRKSRRLPMHAERVLTVGLENLAATLSAKDLKPGQNPKPSGMAVQARGCTFLNVPEYVLETQGPTTWDYEKRNPRSELAVAQQLIDGRSRLRREDIWGDRGLALSVPNAEPAIPKAWILNLSAKGYCLCWVGEDSSCVRVDELIGIPSEDGGLNIGVIRWLSHDTHENLLLGVELLSPAGLPVTISVSGSFEDERLGLVLPVHSGLGTSSTLLTPPSCFKLGQIVLLERAGHRRNCRLEALIEANYSFSHFSVVEVEGSD